MSVRLSRGLLLADLLDDALPLGTLLAVLALLVEAHAANAVTSLLDLVGHNLDLALVGSVELILNHLQSERLALLLLKALLDGRSGTRITASLHLDVKADGHRGCLAALCCC